MSTSSFSQTSQNSLSRVLFSSGEDLILIGEIELTFLLPDSEGVPIGWTDLTDNFEEPEGLENSRLLGIHSSPVRVLFFYF